MTRKIISLLILLLGWGSAWGCAYALHENHWSWIMLFIQADVGLIFGFLMTIEAFRVKP